jgi:hypothetical protein
MKQYLYKLTIIVLATTLLLVMNACKYGHYQVDGVPVYLKGSPEFNNALSEMPITPEDADKLSFEYVSSVQQGGAAYARGPLTAIVGEYYVFAFPEKNYISISGVYVHGNTGAVEERTVDLQIKR